MLILATSASIALLQREHLVTFHHDRFAADYCRAVCIGLQTGRMLRVVVEDGKARFEYFGPLYVFEEQELE